MSPFDDMPAPGGLPACDAEAGEARRRQPPPPPPSARILDVEPEAYHKLPGLSPSLAHVLFTRCPLIARDRYQRNVEIEDKQAGDEGEADEAPDEDEKVSADKQKRLERGEVMHILLLGKGKRIAVIPKSVLGKNGAYSTKDSKALRDAARAAGKVPVKEPTMQQYELAAAEIRELLKAAGHVLAGVSELAIEWWEPSPHGPVQCRTMIDHVVLTDSAGRLSPDPTFATVFEVKFPGDAAPDRSERTSDGLGYHIAAAARHRALDALFPSLAGRIEYRYLFCEPFRPYAFWDPTPTGAFLELGLRQWRTAVNAWAEGNKSGRWLGYHDDIMRRQIDLLSWRKLREGFTPDE